MLCYHTNLSYDVRKVRFIMNLVERNKLLDKVSVIVIIGIFVEFFLFAVDTCFTTRIDLMTTTPVVLNVLGLVFLAVSAFIFIRMYQKNDNKNLIYGIEFLVLAFLCPFMTYWYYPKYFGLSTNFIHKINHHRKNFTTRRNSTGL